MLLRIDSSCIIRYKEKNNNQSKEHKMTIKNLSDLKKKIDTLSFEQVYNNAFRNQTPEVIPDRIKGIRKVVKSQSNGAYISFAKGFEVEKHIGSFWDYPKASNVSFEEMEENKTRMTVTHDDSDWVIKYIIHENV